MKKILPLIIVMFILIISREFLVSKLVRNAHAAYEPIPVYNDDGQLMMLVPPTMRDCGNWKIGPQHYFMGTEEQMRNFIGPVAPALPRGGCDNGNSYTNYVLGIVPEVRFYRDPERSIEMRKILDKEDEVFVKASEREEKIASLLLELESLNYQF